MSTTVTTQTKQAVMKPYQRAANDTGSTEVQIALLTNKISELTEHMKQHRKDFHSRYGLVKMVSKRRKLLKYYRQENPEQYQALLAKLGIRG